MTGRELKDLILLLSGAALCGVIDRQLLLEETEENDLDLEELLHVLEEVIPGMHPGQVEKALETDDGYSSEEVDIFRQKMDQAMTDADWEKAAAKMLAALILNLNLNGSLDLNPHYHDPY